MSEIINRMKAINNKLIDASNAYYNTDSEIMSNYEYDQLYDELVELEKETGVVLSNSITNKVGFEAISSLSKSKHKHQARSLAKTKSKEEVLSFIGDEDACLSWKLDGLTVVLTYKNGELVSGVTRGDGVVGDDITEQVKRFSNVPLKINFKNELIVRGEAVISYDEFIRINENNQFKNPRNLVAGTVKSLDLHVFDERKVDFIVFTVVEGIDNESYSEQLSLVSNLGFDVVEHRVVNNNTLLEEIASFTEVVEHGDMYYPVDGLVIYLDSIASQKELGESTHHPNYAIAFKWQDETKRTVIRKIEWNKSRTGRINPVAIFDSVELEGTTVSRASLHNLSYIESMKINIGDEVSVFKANMIIPQIAENHTKSLKDLNDIIPAVCPVCGCETKIKEDNGSSFLVCENRACGMFVDEIVHFLDKLGIKGASKKTVEKLVDNGVITTRDSIFSIKDKHDEFVKIDGLGEKAFNSLVDEIKDINVSLGEFIASLGIPGVSTQNAKNIARHFVTIEDICHAEEDDFTKVDGIGKNISSNIYNYMQEYHDEIADILTHCTIKDSEEESVNLNSKISGKVFAVTGTLDIFKNRKEIEDKIESLGGKVSGVSSKTDYLITNNPNSGSSKNKKAKELGVTIITEQEFTQMI